MAVRWGKCRNGNRFYFLGFKITVDSDCSHEINRCLLLRRKAMTNLDSIFKSRDITLPTMVHIVKITVFQVVMYGWASWTIKKAEHQKIDAFELWCWRRLLRVPWTARRSNQSILKRNQSWISIGRTDAKAPILWPPDAKSRPTGKNSDAGKDWGQEEKEETEDEIVGWHHWLNWHEFEGQGRLACCSPRSCKESDTTSDWRTPTNGRLESFFTF